MVKEGEPTRAGDRVEVEIDGALPTGEGTVGRMRIALAFPGERVEARIDHIGKNATFGRALRAIRPLRERREAPCPQHEGRGGPCGGCALMDLGEGAQRAWKARVLREHFRLHVDEVQAPPAFWGYRMSVKRIAFGGPGRMRLGSYRRGTQKPADMAGCRVEHPRVRAAAESIVARFAAHGVGAAHEGKPGLRATWIRTDGEHTLVTLVVGGDVGSIRPALEALAPDLNASGVFLAMARGGSGDLRGDGLELLYGIEVLTGFDVPVGPLGFLQPNPRIAARMYETLLAGAQGRTALDLYAGSGAISRRLAARGFDVRSCERDAEGAAALGVEPQDALAFLQRVVDAPDLIVANPPRKGMGGAVAAELERIAASRLHVMACGPAGLRRDLDALPSYRVESLIAFDTLPQTPHCEVVAKLTHIDAV
ncbi:MAG: hypothetical protein AAF938_24200 [Myxococcota bacterium]